MAACCYAALRESEALGLRWRDIDLEAGRIYVRAGKTKASVNSVPIPLPLLAKLKAAGRGRDPRERAYRLRRCVLSTKSDLGLTWEGLG